MIIFKLSIEFSAWLNQQRSRAKSIGFVPTMGALHQGHLSLIKTCRENNDVAASSIFINPTQFNNTSDFNKYPVSLEDDIYLLTHAGCDAVFMPSVNEIYPAGENAEVFDLGYLEEILEGKYRPGHFQGVCQVVKKLLMITGPDTLYLGQKDFQQCMVIKRLMELMDSKTKLIISPTVREADGLAMSSRNRRLNKEQRSIAPRIFETLIEIKKQFNAGKADGLKHSAAETLNRSGFKVDYVEIANADNLKPLTGMHDELAVALIAAYLDDIRLIDNMLLN